MRKTVRIPAAIFYIIAFLTFGFYMFASFNSQVTMPPLTRLILIGVICVFSYVGSLLFSKTTDEKTARKIMKTTFAVFFCLYLFLLVTLVLFDTYFGRVGFSLLGRWNSQTIEHYLQNSFNIIPFKTIYKFITGPFVASGISVSAAITNILGNLIAFVPFALFLPLLFNKHKSFKRFVIAMFVIVFIVEISQLVLFTGFCDIDDVILNVGGACLGYILFNTKKVKKVISKATTLPY